MPRSTPRTAVLLGALLVAPLLLAPLLAFAEEAKPDTRPHTDAQVAPALAQFEKDFAAKDVEDRLKAVRALARWRHKKVLKELTKVFEKNADLELKAAAATGMGQQVSFPKDAGKALTRNLDQWKKWATRLDPEGDEKILNEDEARVLAAAIDAIGALGYKEAWEQVEDYIDHPHDAPAAAMMRMCGRVKEWRALPRILEWFNFYPNGATWSGGSTSVDTGSAGNEDQKAAEAKWKRTYGNRAKKARPAVFDLMVVAVKDITGQTFEKPAELKAWMKENDALLKKNGV